MPHVFCPHRPKYMVEVPLKREKTNAAVSGSSSGQRRYPISIEFKGQYSLFGDAYCDSNLNIVYSQFIRVHDGIVLQCIVPLYVHSSIGSLVLWGETFPVL